MRHAGRAAALQVLYQLDANGVVDPAGVDALIDRYFTYLAPGTEAETRSFAEQLSRDTMAQLERIDRLLERASTNWRLERMSRVDRNILRLAAHELISHETPHAVVIDEAVELGKEYGSFESGAFINGVLGRVVKLLAPSSTGGA